MNIFLARTMQATAAAILVSLLPIGQTHLAASEKSSQAATFDEALRDCRMKQPGRVNRRLNLRVDSPNVAACLRRNGWEASRDTQTRVAKLQSFYSVI